MARRKTLTDNMVAKLKPEAKRLTMPDPEMRGHYIRITPKGAKSFVAVARDPNGKQVWATIGGCDVLTIAEARENARECIRRIKGGLPLFICVARLFNVRVVKSAAPLLLKGE